MSARMAERHRHLSSPACSIINFYNKHFGEIYTVIVIIINVTYMAQIRKKCSKCDMSTVTGVVANVIRNVFSRVRNDVVNMTW